MNWKALVVAVTLVVSVVGTPVAAAATTQEGQGEAHSGTHVSFETTSSAVVDYRVDGETVVEEMKVQSRSGASGGAGAEIGLSGDAGFSGAGLSVASGFQTSTSATVQAESGAEIEAHDNERGVVVVRSNGSPHVAQFNSSDDGEAEKASESRAVITNDDATATVIVVGEGNVSVSGDGNVTATAAEDGTVVYRQYGEERSDSERQQERMIANGTAVAEVYVQAAPESAGEAGDDGTVTDTTTTDTTTTDSPTATGTPTTAPGEAAEERSADVVRYSEDTTVEVTEQSANTFNATVERTESEGRVVIVSVREAAFENAEDARLYVDGEAAAQAESYSEVRSAAEGGDESAYLVRQSSSAAASTDVVVGINHFSERQLSMQSEDGGDGSDGTETGGQPGFGAPVAVTALAGAALLLRRRQ